MQARTVLPPTGSLGGIVRDVHAHRERMAELLNNLDGVQHAVVGDGPTLLSFLTDRLRAGDAHLRALVDRLEQGPMRS
jgi:hypothetical protein